nr:hypothetical protein [Tanacetum cinerariifolium]
MSTAQYNAYGRLRQRVDSVQASGVAYQYKLNYSPATPGSNSFYSEPSDLLAEPSIYTGLDELDEEVVQAAYDLLDTWLSHDALDQEFQWMLSYYASWDYALLLYSENRLPTLTAFVKAADLAAAHSPYHQLPRHSMNNRGLMGRYWQSVGPAHGGSGAGHPPRGSWARRRKPAVGYLAGPTGTSRSCAAAERSALRRVPKHQAQSAAALRRKHAHLPKPADSAQ